MKVLVIGGNFAGMTAARRTEACRSVSQGVECYSCLPKTAWPPTYSCCFVE